MTARYQNGMFYILRTGTPWRDLPERYGRRTTVYTRYAHWARRGVWRDIFAALAQNGEDSLLFIDVSIVKAYRAATDAKGGNWRRISTAGQRMKDMRRLATRFEKLSRNFRTMPHLFAIR